MQSSMKRGSLAIAVIAFAAFTGRADWLQSGVGPYDYNDPANWSGGVINGVFPSSPAFPILNVAAESRRNGCPPGSADIVALEPFELALAGPFAE